MTRVFAKTSANLDFLPPGAQPPLIKPRSIDDVPILTLTLWGPGLSELELRRDAALLRQELSAVADVSETTLTGGRRRPARSASRHRLVATRYSQVRIDARPSNPARPCQADSNVSCSASSASAAEPRNR